MKVMTIVTLTSSSGSSIIYPETAEAAKHDRSMVTRFGAAHPDVPERQVPALPTDVHDLAGLRAVGNALAGP